MSYHKEDWKQLGERVVDWVRDHPWQVGVVVVAVAAFWVGCFVAR